MLTVGIPRGLLFYEYYPLWKTLLEGLGVRVVDSGATSRRILDIGVSECVDEACLPVKAYIGHCIHLSPKCDALFVPRVVSVEQGAYTCPKLLGLPDMVAAAGTGAKLLTPVIDRTKSPRAAFSAALQLGKLLGRPATRSTLAYLKAVREQGTFEAGLPGSSGWFSGDQANVARPGPRVLVLGHTYVINDSGICLDLRNHLIVMGAIPIAPGSAPPGEVRKHAGRLPKAMFWTYEKKIYGSALHHIASGACDGIVQVMSMGCGPDSLVAELIRRDAGRERVPYMALTVDEHTGEAGIVTRIEAFLDMICRKGVRRNCW